jgi:hypothetical protein
MIETVRCQWARPLGRVPLGRRVANRVPVQRFVLCVEATSYALLRRRILSIIALCSTVLLASVWLAAAIAQAQESPSNDRSLTATEPASVQRSIEPQAPHLLLSMVDRSDREPAALRTSAVSSTSSLSNDNKALVYQVGTINFVLNRLPDSSSVSSPRNSLSDPR